MDDKQFDTLVRRLEEQERQSPRLYRARVVLLALLGYGYIGVVLATLLALLGVCVAIMASGHIGALFKLVAALLVAAWFILRAMWVKFEPPKGRRLSRSEAPALFAEADALATALRAPKPEVVLLDDEFNASVSQIPRLGMLGFPRNYLCIGMPLLAGLSKEHVRAVLAHEFAHLSHAHGKFGAWCYRIRVMWFQLLHAIEREQHWTAFIFRRFFHWYVPVFAAYTLVLVRRHELEADELAGQIVGARTMAQTLIDLEVRAAALAQLFWQDVWNGAKDNQAPPESVYSRLASTTSSFLPEGFGAGVLQGALKRSTDTADSHPALRDRVAHLISEPPESLPASPQFADTALSEYLAPNATLIADEMSDMWRSAALENWTKRYQELAAARSGIAELNARPAESLTRDERFQLAYWTEELHGADAALPLFENVLQMDPTYAPAAFNVGRLRLRSGDESGIGLLEDAMTRDVDAIIPACTVIAGWLDDRGRQDEAAPYRERAVARQTLLAEANHERSNITADDSYLPSDLSAEAKDALVTQLDAFSAVKEAFIVRKRVQHFADDAPMHAFVVHVSGSQVSSTKQQAEIVQRIADSVTTPQNVHLFVLTDAHEKLLKVIRRIAGSRVYDAKARKEQRRLAQSHKPPAQVASS